MVHLARIRLRAFLSVAGGLLALAPLSPVRLLAAKLPPYAPSMVEARLRLGHDSNLLDISDLDRNAFDSGDPAVLFAVDRMEDQFWEGEIGGEWKGARVPGRPSVAVNWERRQFFHNPIKSEDVFSLGLGLRLADRTRMEIETLLRPQVYERHLWFRDALPGEPRFRPEVYRRWDLDGIVRQALGSSTTADARLEGSWRSYREPFEGRDRTTFGGGGGVTRSLGRKIDLRGGVRYRATWTRNDPWDPDNRSHRVWRASSRLTMGKLPFWKSASVGLELEWRRFTSTDPDDQDHFGRRDRGGEAEVVLARELSNSLDWVSRGTWRWRSSNFPEAVFDEEGPFEDSVFRTGVAWAWKAP